MKGTMDTHLGSIQIDNEVIAKYAGTIASECFGIVGMTSVNVKIYNFASLKDIAVPTENSGSNLGGGDDGPVIENKTGGGEITIEGVEKKDGKWYIPVKVKNEYLTATQLSFTLDYNSAKAAFKAIEGLDEGTYSVEQKDGEIVITINDFSKVKGLNAGDKYFDIVLDATDAGAQLKDLNLKLSDQYTYTVTTGDGMMFIALAAVVASLGCAVIVTKRRKVTD